MAESKTPFQIEHVLYVETKTEKRKEESQQWKLESGRPG
jgi:hypothetical protein